MFILMLLNSIDDDDGDDDDEMKDLAFLRGLSGSAWCFGLSMMRVAGRSISIVVCDMKSVAANESYDNWRCFYHYAI